jgi:hypothetical protein
MEPIEVRTAGLGTMVAYCGDWRVVHWLGDLYPGRRGYECQRWVGPPAGWAPCADMPAEVERALLAALHVAPVAG